jgi:soluble lytic murein transglycosylase-like protein
MGSATRLAKARLRGATERRVVRPRRAPPVRREWVLVIVEAGALIGTGLLAVIAALGRFADWFVGAGLWRNLLPFAAAVLALALVIGACIGGWFAIRRPLAERLFWAPASLSLLLVVAAGWFASQPVFLGDLHHLQALVGGQAAAERATIGHQVYAAYRRANLEHLQRMFEHARSYHSLIEEAASAFDLDSALLMGVAATESAFRPRTSADGGRGLLQITAPPAAALRAARAALQTEQLDLSDDRHNAFAGAATLRIYLDQMRGDLFLGLLAYNIGPANGGLQAIMQHYGARDFVTIQPYLQQLPRDYPIRVLSAALAYRLWQQDAHLPRYEEHDNAERIQATGIPGLQ